MQRLLWPSVISVTVLALTAAAYLVHQGGKASRSRCQPYSDHTRTQIGTLPELREKLIPERFRLVQPWRTLKLVRIKAENWQSDRFEHITVLEAEIAGFIRMHTLFLRPRYEYNLPVLSFDVMWIGNRGVFVLELINPAQFETESLRSFSDAVRSSEEKTATMEQTVVREWYKDRLMDGSIHVKARRDDDQVLFEVFTHYLGRYLALVRAAVPNGEDQRQRNKAATEAYVDELLHRGGPAVDVFKVLLGEQGERDFVRGVAFGVDPLH